jgi:glycerophosphoryl diester phosphodiesterase
MLSAIAVLALQTTPIVIAHRGASGLRPEHTIEAYQLAIDQGSDFIEPDLVLTKDRVFIARHENELEDSTDVASRPEFANRKTTKKIDGRAVTGWFSEDFTLAEIKTLRATERWPDIRPESARWAGKLEIPTLSEVIELAKAASAKSARKIGIYPELKHPAFFQSVGMDMTELFAKEINASGLGTDQVYVQCFEVEPLVRLAKLTRYPLIQLIWDMGGPFDKPKLTPKQMVSPAGLSDIAKYAQGVGVAKGLVIPRRSDGKLGKPTDLPGQAAKLGLKVHAWTFRDEDRFLPADMKGDPKSELRMFFAMGIDGVFTDQPATAVAVKNERR